MKPLALWLLMQSITNTPSTKPPLTPCKTCFQVAPVLERTQPRAPTRPTPRRPHTGQTH